MGFKEIIQRDITNVFMNPREFGEFHQVGDRRLPLILDDNEMIEREKRTQSSQGADGTYRRKLMFYVAARDFGPLPAVGKLLELDGRKYRIIDSIDESGIYSISLEAIKGL